MRITLNELRRIIREALDEYTPDEISELDQAEKIYSELIMGAMRDNRGNVSSMQAAMRAIPAQVLELTGWSVEEIMKYTEDKTRREIERRKAGENP